MPFDTLPPLKAPKMVRGGKLFVASLLGESQDQISRMSHGWSHKGECQVQGTDALFDDHPVGWGHASSPAAALPAGCLCFCFSPSSS